MKDLLQVGMRKVAATILFLISLLYIAALIGS